VLLLQFSGERLTVKPLDISSKPDFIIYDDFGRLSAFTYARALASLFFYSPRIFDVNEFILNIAPYVEPGKVVGFLTDTDNVIRLTDTLRFTGFSTDLFTSSLPEGLERRGGDLNLTLFEPKSLGAVSLSLSVVLSLCKKAQLTPRVKRIIDQLLDLSDLHDWLNSLGEGIKPSEYQVILSPTMEPSLAYLKNAGLDVKTVANYNILINSLIIYNGSDMMIMRRVRTMISKKSEVKEILLDADPILAPSYLTLKMGA